MSDSVLYLGDMLTSEGSARKGADLWISMDTIPRKNDTGLMLDSFEPYHHDDDDDAVLVRMK